MTRPSLLLALAGAVGVARAQCPFSDMGSLAARAQGVSRSHLSDFEVDDSEGYLTSDVGGNIGDQESLRLAHDICLISDTFPSNAQLRSSLSFPHPSMSRKCMLVSR